MKLQVMAVHDSALHSFGRPFYVATIPQASRYFADEINNSQSELSKHPEDYTLYHLGEFDDSTGKHTDLDTPEIIIRGKDLSLKA